MRVLIAGGGTGGHVIPALAIARELAASHGAELLFVGTPRGLEMRLVPAAGFRLETIEIGALKNVGLMTRLGTLFAMPRAWLRARRLLRDFQPDVVIGVGGYASGPAMLAAVWDGCPTMVFEPNFVPGLANRLVGRRVSAAAVHFPETAKYFRNAQVTGVPVREPFFNLPEKTGARPTLLAFGGSQGASAINRTLVEALPALAKASPDLHVIHQTGERDCAAVTEAYQKAGVSAQVSAFIDDMPAAFARADLLLCRSGAATVAEIAAACKPALLVPFPQAADDHQRRNAEALVRAGAAKMIPESELNAARLVSETKELLADSARLALMGAAARTLRHPDAVREIAAMAVRLTSRQ